MFQRRQKSAGLRARYGMVEVLGQLEPEPARRAARDVGVGREVRVDLNREREHAGPEDRRTSDRDSAKTLLAMTPTLSAMTSFLKKPQQMRTKPLRAFSGEKRRVDFDLRQQERGALDRARRRGAGRTRRTRRVEQAAPRAQLAAIDVDRVAHRLERVERDADRQDDAQRRLACTVSPNAASTAATFSTKKLKYLKNPSIPKFETTLSHRNAPAMLGPAPPCRARRSSR